MRVRPAAGCRARPKPYVDALTAGYASVWKAATLSQRKCLAEATVTAIGAATLRARAMTPGKLRASAKALDAITPTEAQESTFVARVQRCKVGDLIAPVVADHVFKTRHPGGTHCLAQAMDRDPATAPLFVYADLHRIPTKDSARIAAQFVDRCFDVAQATLDDSTLVGKLSDPERACVINDARNRGIFVDLLVLQFTGKPAPSGAENPLLAVLRRCLPPDRIHAPAAGL